LDDDAEKLLKYDDAIEELRIKLDTANGEIADLKGICEV
jgi:hypothetical protein